MADGNPALADPVQNQSDSTSNGATDNNGGQVDVGALQKQVVELQEKYAASSREAHKLVDEVKGEREARLRLEGSLKSQQTTQRDQFPDEESYVKYYSDLGQDERIARSQYRESKINYDNQKVLHQQLIATQNLLRFQKEENERSFRETNPDAQKAIEFAKGIPELESLSVGEKIQRMRELQSRFGIKTEGRDTTAVKLAASGAGGSSSRGVEVTNNHELDQKAKEAGFSSHKEMAEMAQCQTAADHQEWKRRWKK